MSFHLCKVERTIWHMSPPRAGCDLMTTTTSIDGNSRALVRNHSLMVRFTRLRSVALRTTRFGTTNPNRALASPELLDKIRAGPDRNLPSEWFSTSSNSLGLVSLWCGRNLHGGEMSRSFND